MSSRLCGTGIQPPGAPVNCSSSTIEHSKNEDFRENSCHSSTFCSSFHTVFWWFLFICCVFPCAGGMRMTRILSPSSHFTSHFSIFTLQTTFHPVSTSRENCIWGLFVRKLGAWLQSHPPKQGNKMQRAVSEVFSREIWGAGQGRTMMILYYTGALLLDTSFLGKANSPVRHLQ